MTWDPTRDPIMLESSIQLLENTIKRFSKGSRANRRWLVEKDIAGDLAMYRRRLAEVYAELRAERSASASASPGYADTEERPRHDGVG